MARRHAGLLENLVQHPMFGHFHRSFGTERSFFRIDLTSAGMCMVRLQSQKRLSGAGRSAGHRLAGQGSLEREMKSLFRHIRKPMRLFLVFVLVLMGTLPSTSHAFAMAEWAHPASESQVSGRHAHHEHVSVHDHGKGHSSTDPVQADIGDEMMPDQCCPVYCSVALCVLDARYVTFFVADSFEVEPRVDFIVAQVALPERPPRA
ncbi:hypothetical protein [Hoeflea sp.]|uniref:hypothetical protein n=1 Tax=Hoeflea sp. TaxID=1940281 RepID=UPI003BB17917